MSFTHPMLLTVVNIGPAIFILDFISRPGGTGRDGGDWGCYHDSSHSYFLGRPQYIGCSFDCWIKKLFLSMVPIEAQDIRENETINKLKKFWTTSKCEYKASLQQVWCWREGQIVKILVGKVNASGSWTWSTMHGEARWNTPEQPLMAETKDS